MADEILNAPEDAQIEASVATLMADLPKPVQEFLSGPERDATSLRLMQRHGLHADQAGKFEIAFIYMLLGILKPEEFVSDLQQAGLPAETIKNLANDVNEEVFKPLQQKERVASMVASAPVQPVSHPAPVPTPISVPTMPQIAPPAPEAALPAPTPITTASPAPRVNPPQSQIPAQPNPLQVPPPTLVMPGPPPEPEVRTMAGDIAMVKSGTMHIQQPVPAQSAPQTSPIARAPIPPPPPVIRSVPPRISTAQQFVPPIQSAAAPSAPPFIRPAPKAAPTQSENRDALHAILKEYGVDPYREPIE